MTTVFRKFPEFAETMKSVLTGKDGIMKKIGVSELKDNFFDTISKEWMLVTAGSMDSFNMMTASWGCMGWLWNRPVAVIFIRPERHTHAFIEQNDSVNLVFLGNSDEARKAYAFCGSKSGRDHDKAKETGLTAEATENGGVTFTQARLTLECRKLYKDNIKPEAFIDKSIAQWYGGANGGYHDVYVLEITGVSVG